MNRTNKVLRSSIKLFDLLLHCSQYWRIEQNKEKLLRDFECTAVVTGIHGELSMSSANVFLVLGSHLGTGSNPKEAYKKPS